MENLQKQISDQLQQLRSLYLESVEEQSRYEFEKFSKLTEQMVIDSRGYDMLVTYGERKGQTVKRHTKASFAYWGKISSIKYNGVEKYVSKKIKMANLSFEQVENKIYQKAIKKGLIIQNSKAVYYGIGNDGNPHLEVCDGIKSVFCYTIIAMGEIQRPHYRFLIK